jgi:hypothetical protein
VRHLVEAVLERLRADLDRLEEDVVLGVARHGALLSHTKDKFVQQIDVLPGSIWPVQRA